MSFIDQVNDPAHSRLRAVVEVFPEVREFSKTANLDPSEFSDLPDDAFAWPGRRMFPIHNREHAALSYAFSKVASDKLPSDVVSELNRALDIYGIDRSMFNPLLKQAEDTSYYLLPEISRFRVAGPDDVRTTERAFYEKYAQLSVEDRLTAATRLSAIAEHYGVEVSPTTHKLAGQTITNTQILRDQLEARKEAALKKHSSMSEAYAALAKQFYNVSPYIQDRPYQLKVSQVVLYMDKEAGLTGQYGRYLEDPVSAVFNTGMVSKKFLKVGAALNNRALLQALPLSFWQDTLGDEVAKEIAPNGVIDMASLEAILPTLPADMKASLETQLAAYNR